MKNFGFKITATAGDARTGVAKTAHGSFLTPAFMPVGTRGVVKTVAQFELRDAGAEIMLANTYHLFLRPGSEHVAKMGGLQKFTGWNGPILTDSGGYQIFSLGEGSRGEKLVKISDQGVEFKSYLDGSKHFFTPEKVIEIQAQLGSDIMMPLDHCPSAKAKKEEVHQAVATTSAWFERSWEHYQKLKPSGALFAIVQGGAEQDEREASYDFLKQFPVAGFAIGGVANAGESKKKQKLALEYTLPLLTAAKPRYLMGVGLPEDILAAVQAGVDMFDCVEPTRIARHGVAYTSCGKINLKNLVHKESLKNIEDGCDCPACKRFSRGYIRYLFSIDEDLAKRLLSIHNLRFMMRLMEEIRDAIEGGKFRDYKENFLRKYGSKVGL